MKGEKGFALGFGGLVVTWAKGKYVKGCGGLMFAFGLVLHQIKGPFGIVACKIPRTKFVSLPKINGLNM